MAYETEKQSVPEGFTHLGEELGESLSGAMPSEASHEPKIYYPELHFEGKHAEHLLKHLKKHGSAHIHYKKVSESTHHETRNGKAHTRHRVGIQIHGIKPEGGEHVEAAPAKENPEDSIEKGLEAAESESNS